MCILARNLVARSSRPLPKGDVSSSSSGKARKRQAWYAKSRKQSPACCRAPVPPMLHSHPPSSLLPRKARQGKAVMPAKAKLASEQSQRTTCPAPDGCVWMPRCNASSRPRVRGWALNRIGWNSIPIQGNLFVFCPTIYYFGRWARLAVCDRSERRRRRSRDIN